MSAENFQYKGFAATKRGLVLEPLTFTAKPLGPDDVAVEITHCGICHSDLHSINDEWSGEAGGSVTNYPLVPGHEVVGKVVAVGSNVKHLKIGLRVGIGPERNSCRHCEWCDKDEEQLCDKFEMLYGPETGGYAEHIRVNSRFAFPIPDELPSDVAAPLLCAGVTTYSPLAYFRDRLKPNAPVGVIGIGGLGHLAIQYAAKMGYNVTAFSSSNDKEQEAKKLGASRFVNTKDKAQWEQAVRSQDLLLITSSGAMDWNPLLTLLRPNGTAVVLGVSSEKIAFGAFNLVMGRRALMGSPIGGSKDIKEMLEFSAKHKVHPMIEVVKVGFKDAAPLNDAIQRVEQGKPRYRVVLAFQK